MDYLLNHFIVEFSDDDNPETNDLSMSIGSPTVWSFRDNVRSRHYQYLLHCLSTSEKDRVMEDLWKQHKEEILMSRRKCFKCVQSSVHFRVSTICRPVVS